MITVAKASWSVGTRTAVVSPLGAYAIITATRLRAYQCFVVVAYCMVVASWGGLTTTMGPIMVIERERLGHLKSTLSLDCQHPAGVLC